MKTDLTTLARLKSWVNFQGSGAGDDTYLSMLISEISEFVLNRIMRPTAYRKTYNETYDGLGNTRQLLRQWPVLQVNSLTVDGISIAAAADSNSTGYILSSYVGFPPGNQQHIDLFGYQFTRCSSNTIINYDAGFCVTNESATIPGTPFQVTAQAPLGQWMQDDGLTINGVAGVLVASGTPTTGQYKVASGVYTFAAADTGKTVLLNYSYVPVVLEGCALDICGERYKYRSRIGQKSISLNGAESTSFDNTGITKYIDEKLRNYRRCTYV